MKCKDCKWIYANEVCVNLNSKNFGEHTGLYCEDECPDGEELGGRRWR